MSFVGTPIEKSHHILSPAPHICCQAILAFLKYFLTFVNIGPFSTRLEKQTLETDFHFCE